MYNKFTRVSAFHNILFGEYTLSMKYHRMISPTLGHLSSHGNPAITSTASAPPTPIVTAPNPPALGVWLSVPINKRPGKA